MSKVCAEIPKPTPAYPCGRPAMTKYGGRYMCWGCRERYEQQAKEMLRAARNPPRR